MLVVSLRHSRISNEVFSSIEKIKNVDLLWGGGGMMTVLQIDSNKS